MAKFGLTLGTEAANMSAMPTWNAGDSSCPRGRKAWLSAAFAEWQRQEDFVVEDHADERKAHFIRSALAPTHRYDRIVRILGIALELS
jgi:hypothetical protein